MLSVKGFAAHGEKLLAAQFTQTFGGERLQFLQRFTQHLANRSHGHCGVTLGTANRFGHDLVDQPRRLRSCAVRRSVSAAVLACLGSRHRMEAQASGEITE